MQLSGTSDFSHIFVKTLFTLKKVTLSQQAITQELEFSRILSLLFLAETLLFCWKTNITLYLQAYYLRYSTRKLGIFSKMATQIHLANLKKLCRICGTLVLGKVNYLVNNYTDRLEIAYRCKFTGDKAEIHPEQFCNNCYCKLVNVESRGSVHCIEPISWEEHCDKCKTCVKVVKIVLTW